ncbi:MAG: ABC transporter ATP-binding protein [Campylobacter sputorum]|uniref:ABC transporter ATP-binding protein n=1 Tax=Campylobacter sputorum TaxID=206 RepID=UPI000B77B084|nr:ABC transporter ATP-binding protein [Campylobacter sputorum]ASM38099.1 copper ABC transporter NosDFY, putative ATP-binding protein NosF [Campylobacter sputorum bv. paraureolyticus LMG 11764]MDY6121247.1 ABC transporter ATP-binding protein [Campylobacter sputorum]
MIEIVNITKKFGEQVVLDNVNINIAHNQNVLFIGQNGAGKSSLMKTILGQYLPDSGYVSIDGFSPLKERKKALRNLTFVPQTPPPIKFNINELISYVSKSSNTKESEIYKFCEKLDFDLKQNLKKPFYKLSGGMKQKFLIAIAFARNVDIMLFDEPTANLDPLGRDKFSELLKEYFRQKSMIFISHRLDEIGEYIHRVIQMDFGAIVKDEIIVGAKEIVK